MSKDDDTTIGGMPTGVFGKMTLGAVLASKAGTTEKEPIHWIGEVPPKCQLSGRRLTTSFVDGRVPRIGSWAIIHPDYFRQIGGTLGLGCGQRYEKQANGRWLKVEG